MDVDYEIIWKDKWIDCSQYGPSLRHEQRLVKKLLKSVKITSLLDVGCGNGKRLSMFLKDRKIDEVWGIDLSKEAILQTKKLIPKGNFVALDIQKDFLAKTFDLVMCCDVIEHLQEDTAALTNMAKMTNKYLIITTIQGRIRESEKMIGHVQSYTRESLVEKLKNAGFASISIIEWGFPFYSPIHRFLLDKSPQITEGRFGVFRKVLSQIVYFLFYLNLSCKGDILIILAKK
ncbi:MAG: class I SAM-dependent methyltransferase [bacterium]